MEPTLLHQFPGLSKLPHVSLGAFPTPLERLDGLSTRWSTEVYVKREDVSGVPYGGNKVRKLEFLLGAARRIGATRLISIGGVGSNHLVATAIYGESLGIPTSAVWVRQPLTAKVKTNIRAFGATGVSGVLCSYPTVPLHVSLLVARSRLSGERPYFVPAGGSSPLATVGWVSAVFELRAQLAALGLADPERIYAPLGSGGTIAGLALGVAFAGMDSEVVGVRVVSRLLANDATVRRLARACAAILARRDPTLPPIPPVRRDQLRVVNGYLGRGYGHPTDAAIAAVREAREVDNLQLETTYTGKALAGMRDDLSQRPARRPVLFWNTFSSVDLSARLKSATLDSLPADVRALLDEPTVADWS
ncbi:MAG: pyridoxal-phosphate dependent enzyme [Myxococcales bacterium]|nr:pyridoxal-phosphate dependent enzyme [Myxococcales bacterium]